MPTTPTARTAAAALLAALFALPPLTGCGGGNEDEPREPRATGDAASGTATDPAAVGTLNATDLAWIQLMIPVNDQLLPLLDDVAERGSDPAFREFAAGLAEQHRSELTELHALLDEAGVEYTNLHEGHDMPGMVTEDELTALAATEGAAFDREAKPHLREHLEQSARVSRSEAESGADADATALAAGLEEARADQLAELTALDG
ncbi:DUF305 domain-containing protein [Streptomyces radicis]|uniref:DUF305 domain-containing protein n=1 Tax=Streptomyces radicis TaxID=1750517 RepID=A0A3A9WJ69_9ACTN|nr:DUF305 domain-containing protein [Streptomyces radicis]RKN06127.1 DUF305 domain-containing protein [Streptomyces radicis]RKN18497.1 DUF305 domain-containing protein [Streptomyces radicis]